MLKQSSSLTETLETLNSKRVLERLRQGANKQRRDSLTRVEATCDALDRCEGELTFANIGRRCLQDFKKGPIKSSLKNDAGFKEYVQARREERLAQGQAKQARRKAATPTANLIERIPDQGLRSRMRMVYADALELRRRLADLQAALLLIAPGLDVETIVSRYRANPGAPVSAAPPRQTDVQPEDLEGLRALLVLLTRPRHWAGSGSRMMGSGSGEPRGYKRISSPRRSSPLCVDFTKGWLIGQYGRGGLRPKCWPRIRLRRHPIPAGRAPECSRDRTSHSAASLQFAGG